MNILNYILLTFIFLFTPSIVISLCNKYKWMNKIGPILWLYAIGMLLGNVNINGYSLFPDQIQTMQDILSSAMVPLAIPLMLFSCTLNKKEIGQHFKAMTTGIAAVVIAVVAGYFLFRNHLTEPDKLAGMLTGVYTGGTINLAAIKEGLNASNETYILIQTYDIIVCLSYLIFLMVCGISLFRKFLPFDASAIAKKRTRKHQLTKEENAEKRKLERELNIEEIGFRSIFTKQGMKNSAVVFGAALLVVILSAGVTLLTCGGQLNMTVFYLIITTLGIAGSFIKNIHDRKQHYNIGLYCIYIFSLVIASMADFNQLKETITHDFWLPIYMAFAVFGSLMLHALLAKIFKVDADTMVITSVTYINSPAFVPMIAASMRNRNVIIPGLTIGIIGFAIGNYLGTIIAYIL